MSAGQVDAHGSGIGARIEQENRDAAKTEASSTEAAR
jgi:hypothetical protein